MNQKNTQSELWPPPDAGLCQHGTGISISTQRPCREPSLETRNAVSRLKLNELKGGPH